MRYLAPVVFVSVVSAHVDADDKISYTRSDTLLIATGALGAVHIVDHFLRKDSSGWPVEGGFRPIDGVAIALPLYIGAGETLDGGPLYWIAGDSVLLVLVGFEHSTRENPFHVHDTWTHPDENVPGVNSPTLGVVSNVAVGLLLASMAAHIASNVKDGIDEGFTWKRRHHKKPERSAIIDIFPTPDGASAGVAGTF
jgi:hypothetical protein